MHDSGLLPTDRLIKVDAEDMVGSYVGQTKDLVTKFLNDALGGVLFIDEAHRLNPKTGAGGFKQEALGKILEAIESPEYKNKLLIVMAGYVDDIDDLMRTDQGLARRFRKKILFRALELDASINAFINRLNGHPDVTNVDVDYYRPIVKPLFEELIAREGWSSLDDIDKLVKGFDRELAVENQKNLDNASKNDENVEELQQKQLKEYRSIVYSQQIIEKTFYRVINSRSIKGNTAVRSIEQQKSQASHVHVFLSTPDMQQLPSYLNADTLEVDVNEYSMIEEIGAGGFAVVYKGVHTASKREVVIKKIRGAAANSNKENMFAKEMSKTRFLAHQGIPKVEAFYRLGTDICLVFQESNGLSVRCVMDENERSRKVPQTVPSLLPFDVARLTVRLIEILNHVHAIGVIHYDIKPENVLLCSSEYGVQLIDFGSAGFVSNTAKTANTSTPSYSPPEKLDALVFDEVKSNKTSMLKLDVWSLGATILNACCGALLLTDKYEDDDDLRPYFSITSLAKGVIKLDDDHKIPWDLDLVLSKYFEVCREAKAVWDAVDSDVKDIIRACLTRDISKRPFTRDITQMQSFQRLRNKV